MLTQSSGIHLTIDLKKTTAATKKNIIHVIHSFQNCILSHYQAIKHLEALAKRFCIDQMQNRTLFLNGEYASMLQNLLQHTDTSNTELLISKTRYQSIVSLLSLYRFFLKFFSNKHFSNIVPKVIVKNTVKVSLAVQATFHPSFLYRIRTF